MFGHTKKGVARTQGHHQTVTTKPSEDGRDHLIVPTKGMKRYKDLRSMVPTNYYCRRNGLGDGSGRRRGFYCSRRFSDLWLTWHSKSTMTIVNTMKQIACGSSAPLDR